MNRTSSAQLRGGSLVTLEALYDAYHRQALGLAYALLADADAAEGVAEEALLGAWRSRETYGPASGTVRRWLLGRVRETCAQILRVQGRARLAVDGTHAAPRPHADVNAPLPALGESEIELREISRRLLIAGLRQQELVEEAEEARRRFALLVEVSGALASANSVDAALEAVARLVVPSLADGCSVEVVEEDGSLRRVAVAGQPDASESYMAVPLVAADGRTLGSFTFLVNSPRRCRSRDLVFAEDLARRCALAVENAQLAREVRRRERLDGVLLAARTARHMVNNQLSRTTGYADMLAVDDALPAHLRALASEALDGATDAARTLERLQLVTRLEEVDGGGPGGTILDLDRSIAAVQ